MKSEIDLHYGALTRMQLTPWILPVVLHYGAYYVQSSLKVFLTTCSKTSLSSVWDYACMHTTVSESEES